MKKYAVVIDISPSEQIDDKDNDVKIMALAFGLRRHDTFEKVGRLWPDEKNRLSLKKWAPSGRKYKTKSVKHLKMISDSNNIIFGSNLTSNKLIREIGIKYWELLMPDFPLKESGKNPTNRVQVTVNNLTIDDEIISPFTVLKDELIVLGWYAEALVGCLKSLCDVNGEMVKLDVLIDKLPNEQGGFKNYKGALLKEICKRGSVGNCNVVGVPKISDTIQRDLLVDNVAGLRREIYENNNSELNEAITIFKFNRQNL